MVVKALPVPLRLIYERLGAVSAPVAQRYAEVAVVMQDTLTAVELLRWGQYCLRLAQCGWRTWESAEAFLGVSPFLVQYCRDTAFWAWAEHGIAMAQHSAEVATAFFQAVRPLLRQAAPEVFTPWVAGGQWYLQHAPARLTLAAEYFRVSPLVYGRHALPVCERWGQLGQDLTRAEAKYGQAFFAVSRTLLDQELEVDLPLAWDIARQVVPYAPEVALHYLEHYPDLAHRFGAADLAQVHALLLALLTPGGAEARTLLRLVGGTLGFMPAAERQHILGWCQQIASVSRAGVLDFLHRLPELIQRLPGQRLQPWVATGIEVAQRQSEAGQAYFALESATAQERLRALQKWVTFADVERLLQLYTEAMLGRRIVLRTLPALPSQPQPLGHGLPTTDGAAIFVPEQVDDFAEARENLAVYKVAILHQVGFYECETFAFSVEAWLRRLPGTAQRLATLGGQAQDSSSVAFGRFFGLFPQAELARQLFTICEDARIDAHLARRYKGIRHDLARVMQHSLQQRPPIQDMPLRRALLEGLLQVTLGGTASAALPPGLRILLQRLGHRLHPLLEAGATVYDTATAVLDCYCLITAIPGSAAAAFSPAAAAQLEALAAQMPDDAETIALADLFLQAGESADVMPVLPESAEPAVGVEPVPYRGEVKPELIQKRLRLEELMTELERLPEPLSPLPPELLKALLERGEIKITSVQEGDLSATSGLFVSDLEGRNGSADQAALRRAELQQEVAALRDELGAAYGALAAPGQAVLYDEWDYLIGDYRQHWCRLTETVLPEDGVAFVEETRRKYADLLVQVCRQFQLLKPEMFKKIKRLTDGEDIDLDSAIAALVDRRAGNAPPDNVYMRRNKRDRSVAAVFLLDMSASTDDEVKEPAAAAAPATPVRPPPRLYDFSGFVREDYYAPLPPRSRSEKPRRRIIDVEKEALVLMAEALETLGDAYAVYGFSGYGRDQVDFFIAKEFTDPYDARVQGRIAAVKPHRSTRMGPAIRHAVYKLERQEARLKTLLLLSDGYPQDYDYGKDRNSKDYGVQDTMMALHEARRKGIQTFCITVDPAGHDYLREMCPDANYLVIEEIASLPNVLPKIYRGLTT
jgi:nitric oxide reductase activation protein